MDLRKAVLRELLGSYKANGPNNYCLIDELKCYRPTEEYRTTIHQLLAEGLIVRMEGEDTSLIVPIERDTTYLRTAAIALNPVRHQEVSDFLKPPRSPDDGLLSKVLLLVLVLGLGLLGFVVLRENLLLAMLWFLFCLVCYPLMLAFTHKSSTLKGDQLIKLYQEGVRQIPLIGEMLSKVLYGGTGKRRNPK